MEFSESHKIGRPKERYQANVSKQTGFPSPATHYQEYTIDLNKELLDNNDATFYVRVKGDNQTLHIYDGDVLIIDKSLTAKPNRLALIIKDGEFNIVRIPNNPLEDQILVWGIITYIIHSVL